MASSQPVASTSAAVSPANGAPAAPTAADAVLHADANTATADMHFDRAKGRWIYEDATGKEMEWDEDKKTWVSTIDEDLAEAQQRAYSVAGVDESAPADVIARRETKKRKKAEGDDGPAKKSAREKAPPRNTAVYATKLPIERPPTIEELQETFSKAGLVLEDAEGTPKIKLYTDPETGRFNGEALIVYLNEASVELAVRLLDETELRLGEAAREGVMSVQPAKFDHKKQPDQAAETRRRPDQQKAKAQRKADKQRSKVTDWDDSDDEDTAAAKAQRFNRIVVLARMFSLVELEEDPALLLDLKEDVREESESFGRVTNVTLYDKEPEGVMTVKFADPIAAQACIAKMNGRYFGGRQVIAGLYDGARRFRRSGKGGPGEDDEADEAARLENFARFLEEEGD